MLGAVLVPPPAGVDNGGPRILVFAGLWVVVAMVTMIVIPTSMTLFWKDREGVLGGGGRGRGCNVAME